MADELMKLINQIKSDNMYSTPAKNEIHTKLKKLINTHTEQGEKFLKNCKTNHIEFFGHMMHTFKKHTPPELKSHISHILKSKTPRIAKARMIKAHLDTQGGFFDFFKRAGNSISDIAKKTGNSIYTTATNFYDKAVPIAQKGLEYAKPYVKEYGPYVAGKAAAMIPVIGPIAEPIAKKGTEWLLNKFF